ncbi:aldose 1-epimerase family protein [[Collinsella] massiliensis]|uniref:Aldose epimerase n=1 Tax=[Collinsella] massiliensis TaxID=1232426 RepID=A0A1Y3XX22_9ACTN|nr:aldose 1-epimerase family protein [[Collinsella] massiliensis]OUN86590.1 aldose epimerase [[Collinsella] massiliensis]
MSQVVTITNNTASASIDSKGAQLTSLALDGREYLWQADPRWWGKHAPVLFPIVGTLRDGRAASAQGEVRLGRHGFARDMEHAIVSRDDASVTFEITDTPETRAVYPCAFRLNMAYALTGPASLTQTFRVENTGDVPLPFSVGGHPAFNVPAPGGDGEAWEDYVLEFAEPWTYESPTIADGGLLTYDVMNPIVDATDRMPLTRAAFRFDTIMLEGVPQSTVSLRGAKSGHGVRLDFEGFPYLGVWAGDGVPFVALEPWTGHATLTSEDDIFEHKRSITLLEPGAVDERSFTVTLL